VDYRVSLLKTASRPDQRPKALRKHKNWKPDSLLYRDKTLSNYRITRKVLNLR
jgi:hypothetical protein